MVIRLAAGTRYLIVICSALLSCTRGDDWVVVARDQAVHAPPIQDIQFVDMNRGFAATGGPLLGSLDGGRNWSEVLAGASFRAVLFPRPELGLALGAEIRNGATIGLVAKTSDGGLTWNRLESGSLPGLATGAGCGPNSIFVATDRGEVYRSSDGASSWDLVYKDPGERSIFAIACVDPAGEVWATGATGLVLRTMDRGASWAVVDVGAGSKHLAKVHFRDQVGFVVGWSGLLIRTEDRGEKWQVIPLGTASHLYDVTTTEEDAWIVGDDATLLQSRDLGQTWHSIPVDSDADLLSLDFIGADRGWIGGSSATVLRLDR